jgi:hypothetical protein
MSPRMHLELNRTQEHRTQGSHSSLDISQHSQTAREIHQRDYAREQELAARSLSFLNLQTNILIRSSRNDDNEDQSPYKSGDEGYVVCNISLREVSVSADVTGPR